VPRLVATLTEAANIEQAVLECVICSAPSAGQKGLIFRYSRILALGNFSAKINILEG
jgi:hypothetical protein